MRRLTLTIGATIAAALPIGCARPHVNAPAPAAESIVRVPFDVAWPRVIAFFANSNVPIQTLDKASGLIASQQLALSPYQRLTWVNCKSNFFNEITAVASSGSSYSGNFNVLARSLGDSTYVRVNFSVSAFITTKNGPAAIDCASNGRFEQQLLASLATPMAAEIPAASVQPQLAASPTPARDSPPMSVPTTAPPTTSKSPLASTASSQQSRRPRPVPAVSTPVTGESPEPTVNGRLVAVVPTTSGPTSASSPPAGSATGPETPVASEAIGAPRTDADRHSAWTAYQNGRAYLGDHQWSKSEGWLREAIRLDGSRAEYHAELGQLYMTLEKWPDAEAAFTAAVLLDIDNARYRQLLKESRAH